MDEARDRNEPASLVERGRRLVRASADIPLEALEFLGLPLMRTRRRPPQGATPGEMVEADVSAARTAGASDGEILEVNQVCAYFNYSNRLLNGLGVTTEGDHVGYYDDGDAG